MPRPNAFYFEKKLWKKNQGKKTIGLSMPKNKNF
jgi:hypothetical protein